MSEQSNEGRHLPVYNMKVVVQETGLSPMTIRTWERRYGLPRPPRAQGGHRLYSQHDIDTLKWLIARQAHGLSIRNAADLWRSLEAKGEDPLLEVDAASTAPLTRQRAVHMAEQREVSIESTEAIAQLRARWLSACLQFERTAADDVLVQAFSAFPPELVCTELLGKAISQIGEGWVAGEVTIQQEHFASALAVRRLESLVAGMPVPSRSERVLICCAPDEYHVFSPLLLTFFLLRKGWDVLYLGANVPADAIIRTVAQTKPDLVVISAQRLHTAASLLDVAHALASEGVPLGYGGAIFNLVPHLRSSIPGSFLGESIQAAVQRIQELLAHVGAAPAADSAAPLPVPALDQYQAQRAQIEAHAWTGFSAAAQSSRQLMAVNQELAQTIIAALKLGGMGLAGSMAAFVELLLLSHSFSPELLGDYLLAYAQAARVYLGAPAATVVDWLTDLAAAGHLA